MSLKAEQRLDEFFFTEIEPRIYSTGAFLVPMEIGNGIKKKFVWIVDEFSDDTYFNGNLCSPAVYADKKANLFGIIDDDLNKKSKKLIGEQ